MPKGKKPKDNKIQLPPLPSMSGGNDKSPKFNFSLLTVSGFTISDLDKTGKADLISRIEKLSSLTWQGIHQSDKHKWGTEFIPVKNLRKSHPDLPTELEKVMVFRRNGKLNVMAGYRPPSSRTFVVLWIEKNFGELYDHGS